MKIVGLLDNPLFVFFISAIFTLCLSLLSQWLFTNWKIKRDFRIKLLEETFNPLYKLASDVIETLERQRYDTTVWTAPGRLQEIVMSDVRFSMLKEDERTTIERVATIINKYEKTISVAQRTLIPLWNTPFAPIIEYQGTTTRETVITILRNGIWSAFMDQSSPTADDLIQETDLEPKVKRQISELAQKVFQEFEATQEYKNYVTTRDEALPIIKNFRESLTKWTSSMFSLTSR